MACGGFTCSKNALAALNVLYILVAFILIGVAGYSRGVAVTTSITIIGGIIACGVFLLLVAIIGLIGAVKHHQVLLFFYMIILFLLFLVQFAVACACLAVTKDQQEVIARQGWMQASNATKSEIQYAFNCCGFDINSQAGPGEELDMFHPVCGGATPVECCANHESDPCCSGVFEPPSGNTTSPPQTCHCQACYPKISTHMDQALKISGGIGLFFSFTEIVGVWLAMRFRNLKDPRANPSAFL